MVHFFPFYFEVSLLKLTIGKKDTLIINGLLGNLLVEEFSNRGKLTNRQYEGYIGL